MTTMDEKLSAYLDNMLPEDERAGLEALLAVSPELADRLEALALANADFISHAADIDRVPMSGTLDRQLQSLSGAAAGGSNVTPFRPRAGLPRFLTEHRALAACAAVAAGIFAWQATVPASTAPGGMDAGGMIYADTSLGRMLSTATSDTVVGLGDGAEGRVRFTFASTEGDWCRLADLEQSGNTSRLVACQSGEDWRVMIAAYSGPADGAGTDVYRTASTQAVASVEDLLDTMMQDAPLGPDEEKDVIRQGWSPANAPKGDTP